MKLLKLASLFLLTSLSVFSQNYSEDKAILASAQVNEITGSVTISWPIPSDPATGYNVYRRLPGATTWGSPIASLSNAALSFSETGLTPGALYEYRILKMGTQAANAYLTVGIGYENTAMRGTCLLLIDVTYIPGLLPELNRFKQDLQAEGWRVIEKYIPRNMPVPQVKDSILQVYNSTPDLSSLILIGHIPVPYSGNIYPDGHPDHQGAWPADGYYGDMNGNWTDVSVNNTVASRIENKNIPGDGKFDQNQLASPLEISVGRIDLFNMPSFSGDDEDLTRKYFDKDHTFRMNQFPVVYKGVVEDNFGGYAEGFSAAARTGFAAVLGDTALQVADYSTTLNNQGAIYSYGCGGGSYTSCGGIYSSSGMVSDSNKTIFTSLFGSYFGDWDNADNMLRAPLAHKGWTLTNFWSGRPYFFIHSMASGNSIGDAAKTTMNFTGNYMGSSSALGAHQALLGDPTLTLYPFVSNEPAFTTTVQCGTLNVNWNNSDTQRVGYRVYIKYDADSAWQDASGNLENGSFSRNNLPQSGNLYVLIREVKRIRNASGIFYFPGAGILDTFPLSPYPVFSNALVTQDSTGSCVGSIQLQFTGSSNPSWSWVPNVSTASSATGLCPDNYTITLSDLNSGCSADTTLELYSTLSTPELFASAILYPNPAQHTLQFTWPEGTENTLSTIVNTQGQLLWSGQNPSGQWDVSSWPAGVYYLRIEGFPAVFRFLKE